MSTEVSQAPSRRSIWKKVIDYFDNNQPRTFPLIMTLDMRGRLVTSRQLVFQSGYFQAEIQAAATLHAHLEKERIKERRERQE